MRLPDYGVGVGVGVAVSVGAGDCARSVRTAAVTPPDRIQVKPWLPSARRRFRRHDPSFDWSCCCDGL